MGDSQDSEPTRNSDLSIQKLARYQVVVPLVSALISVLSFVIGGLFAAYQSRASQADLQLTEWRTAIQQIKFEENSLVPSAFLLESYEGTQHEEEARRLQVAMLERTTTPETFDLIFQDMLTDAAQLQKSKQEDPKTVLEDLLDVELTLNEHLYTLWTDAMRDLPPQQAKVRYEKFLADPTSYFSSSERSRLNTTLILMWELDTFSRGMDCVWNSNRGDCPHLSKGLPDIKKENMLLTNYNAPYFATIKTCAVHHAFGEEQYECD